MLFFAGDEHDEDRDDEEDADFDSNSDDEGNDDDNGEESDDSDAGDDSGDDEENDDDKPVTKKEFREMLADALKSKGNRNNANRRVNDKKGGKPSNNLPPEIDRRVSTLEKKTQENAILETKRQFGYEHGLSPKQVNHVFRLTKRPTAKFLDIPHVKAALDTIKSQENIARNTPSGSGKRGTGGGDGKKWSDLKPEERQSGFAARRQEILQKKSR